MDASEPSDFLVAIFSLLLLLLDLVQDRVPGGGEVLNPVRNLLVDDDIDAEHLHQVVEHKIKQSAEQGPEVAELVLHEVRLDLVVVKPGDRVQRLDQWSITCLLNHVASELVNGSERYGHGNGQRIEAELVLE